MSKDVLNFFVSKLTSFRSMFSKNKNKCKNSKQNLESEEASIKSKNGKKRNKDQSDQCDENIVAQKIIIPKGTINPSDTTVIEIPAYLRTKSVVIVTSKAEDYERKPVEKYEVENKPCKSDCKSQCSSTFLYRRQQQFNQSETESHVQKSNDYCSAESCGGTESFAGEYNEEELHKLENEELEKLQAIQSERRKLFENSKVAPKPIAPSHNQCPGGRSEIVSCPTFGQYKVYPQEWPCNSRNYQNVDDDRHSTGTKSTVKSTASKKSDIDDHKSSKETSSKKPSNSDLNSQETRPKIVKTKSSGKASKTSSATNSTVSEKYYRDYDAYDTRNGGQQIPYGRSYYDNQERFIPHQTSCLCAKIYCNNDRNFPDRNHDYDERERSGSREREYDYENPPNTTKKR